MITVMRLYWRWYSGCVFMVIIVIAGMVVVVAVVGVGVGMAIAVWQPLLYWWQSKLGYTRRVHRRGSGEWLYCGLCRLT